MTTKEVSRIKKTPAKKKRIVIIIKIDIIILKDLFFSNHTEHLQCNMFMFFFNI
jgi:hypothetical protein